MAAIQYQKGWLDVLKMHDNILEAADYLHELGNRDYGTYMTHQHTMFEQIVDQIVEEIQANSSRRKLVKDLPKLTESVTKLIRDTVGLRLSRSRSQWASIHKGKAHYKKSRYISKITYDIHIGRAYDSMINLGYLNLVKKGASTGIFGHFLTRYEATDKLVKLLGIQDYITLSALLPTQDIEELIQVQEKRVIGKDDKGYDVKRNFLLEYEDNDVTKVMRSNTTKINNVLTRHWYDLEITNAEWHELLEQNLNEDSTNADHDPSINLANRTLYRIFNDIEFKTGGRFYGTWWQNVPSKYRSRIVIDGKRTKEYDFSGLHPNILYAMGGLAFPDDPYDNLVKGVPRKVGKVAFNAMLNSPKELMTLPDLTLSQYDVKWAALSAAIIERHKPIAHHFYTGIGKELQKRDSDIAEDVMLHFAKLGVPVLPVHDSFVMHQGYEKELQGVMGKAFRDRFGRDIGIKLESKMPHPSGDGEPVSMSMDDILNGVNGDCHQRLEVFRSEVSHVDKA